MGPKLFHVPVLLGLAYIGMAYVSWTLARLIIGKPYAPVSGTRIVALPLVASFIMVAWDLAQDPVWGTVSARLGLARRRTLVRRAHLKLSRLVLRTSSSSICSLRSICARRPALAMSRPARRCGARQLLLLCSLRGGQRAAGASTPPSPTVAGPTGKQWRVADITGASALVSIFVMGGLRVRAESHGVPKGSPMSRNPPTD